MKTYALDSNMISFFLKGNTAVIERIATVINENHSIVIPPIVYYEVKRGLLMINATKKLSNFEDFCKSFPVGEFGNYIMEEAVEIYVKERKEKRNTEDADIFIAVFCMHNDYILVTDNTKHFQNIKNLRLENWKQ